MLRFPNEFVDDPKANEIVKSYMNQRIVKLMRDIVVDYCQLNGKSEIKPSDREFEDFLYPYFPDHYSAALRPAIFLGLYELLTAEEEKVPSLIMEYVMNSIFEVHADLYEDPELAPKPELIPERDYVLSKLHEMYDEPEDEYSPTAEQVLARFEDAREYVDIYFWDVDFRMLDICTEQQIADSEINQMLGIMDEGTYTRRFILPVDWLK